MNASYKLGDKLSLEDREANVVLCRGSIRAQRVIHGQMCCSLDMVHYFRVCPPEGHLQVIPKEDTEGDYEFNTPFHHISSLRYGFLDGEEEAEIYLDRTPEVMASLGNQIKDRWVEIYPNCEVSVDVAKNLIVFSSDDKEELEDMIALAMDKVNIFGKTFCIDEKVGSVNRYELTHSTDGDVDCYLDYFHVLDYLDALIDANYRKMKEEDLLYLNNYGRRSFQWELWSMCNNLCTYCYLGKENRHTDKARQMTSLNDLHMAIDNLDTRIYNNIAIIGGDFW